MKEILKYNVFLIFCIFFSSEYAKGQQDSIQVVEEDSVVYVYEPPVVIQKTVHQKEEVYDNWFLEFSASSFIHSNKHVLCEECYPYVKRIGESIKPIFGKNVGLKIVYKSNQSKIIYSLGISYTSFAEKFEHTDDSFKTVKSLNKYNYVDFKLGTGYWINRKGNISFIVNGDLIFSKLVKRAGYTFDYFELSKPITVKDANREAAWVLGGRLGFKAVFFNNKRIKIFIEPYTQVNFTSVLRYRAHYYQRRWANGLGAGIIYVL